MPPNTVAIETNSPWYTPTTVATETGLVAASHHPTHSVSMEIRQWGEGGEGGMSPNTTAAPDPSILLPQPPPPYLHQGIKK